MKIHFSVPMSRMCWPVWIKAKSFQHYQKIATFACGKIRLKKYTIPLFDIIRCKKIQKSAKNDRNGMLKIQK